MGALGQMITVGLGGSGLFDGEEKGRRESKKEMISRKLPFDILGKRRGSIPPAATLRTHEQHPP